MSNEYYPVILEFNEREIKLGLAGESACHVALSPDSTLWKRMVPRIENDNKYPDFLELSSHSLNVELQQKLEESAMKDASTRSMVQKYLTDKTSRLWYDWSLDKYQSLCKILKYLSVTSLLVSPSKVKLFVIDCGFSAAHKYNFCSTFLNERGAVSITFLPFSPCCCISAGVDNAMVISLTWRKCTIASIMDLRVVSSSEYPEFSGEAAHYKQLFYEPALVFGEIEEALCKGGWEKFLFKKHHFPRVIAKCIMDLNMDMRSSIASTILFTGPVFDTIGTKGRFLTELAQELPGSQVSGKICLGAWSGASLYCSTTMLKDNASKWRHKEILKENLSTKTFSELETLNQ